MRIAYFKNVDFTFSFNFGLGESVNAGYNQAMSQQNTYALFVRHILIISLLLVSSSILTACGKKGPLYIADDVAVQQADNKEKSKKAAEKIPDVKLEPAPIK